MSDNIKLIDNFSKDEVISLIKTMTFTHLDSLGYNLFFVENDSDNISNSNVIYDNKNKTISVQMREINNNRDILDLLEAVFQAIHFAVLEQQLELGETLENENIIKYEINMLQDRNAYLKKFDKLYIYYLAKRNAIESIKTQLKEINLIAHNYYSVFLFHQLSTANGEMRRCLETNDYSQINQLEENLKTK